MKQKIHLNSTEQQNPRIWVNLIESSTKIKQNLKNQTKIQRKQNSTKFKELCLRDTLSDKFP